METIIVYFFTAIYWLAAIGFFIFCIRLIWRWIFQPLISIFRPSKKNNYNNRSTTNITIYDKVSGKPTHGKIEINTQSKGDIFGSMPWWVWWAAYRNRDRD